MENFSVIALGCNMGKKLENLNRAVHLLSQNTQINVIKISSFIQTDPVGYLDQDKFLNGAVLVETNFTCLELLKFCNNIEETMGRIRSFKNAPRVIDLDIIFFNDTKINLDNLIVPHPRWKERDFVKIPLFEIAKEDERIKNIITKYL